MPAVKQQMDSAGLGMFSKKPRPLLQPRIDIVKRGDGTVLATSPLPLNKIAKSFPAIFEVTATRYPQRIFLRQREAPGKAWRSLRYGEALIAARAVAQWLMDQGGKPRDVVAILSEQSIDHVVVMLGTQFAGMTAAPLSPSYSLLSTDHAKLKQCLGDCKASFVFAEDGVAYAEALLALRDFDPALTFIVGTGAKDMAATALDDVRRTPITSSVEDAMDAITLDRVGRIMFTAGSTGSPKAVPQTQRNLVTTVAQIEALGLLDFTGEGAHCLEAMPYSHIMAGNFNFSLVVSAAGTISFDDGKPTPPLFHRTIQNLRETSPHFYITVPIGYTMLCDAMERDDELRDSFFLNLRFLGFGGAALPDQVARRLQVLSLASRGCETPLFSFYGATEYLLGAMQYWNSPRMDVIGLPPPGVICKLAPAGSKFELRVKSETMIPATGYLGEMGSAQAIFDEEGFYRTGDLVSWMDADNPTQGLVFEGRLAEEFKLATGTWVSVGSLRSAMMSACDPLLRDVVICGLNRDWIGLLVWLNEEAARRVAGDGAASFSAKDLTSHPEVREALRIKILEHNKTAVGSSARIGRAMIMTEPLRETELSAKQAASQALVLEQRAVDVRALYREDAPGMPNVIDFLPPL